MSRERWIREFGKREWKSTPSRTEAKNFSLSRNTERPLNLTDIYLSTRVDPSLLARKGLIEGAQKRQYVRRERSFSAWSVETVGSGERVTEKERKKEAEQKTKTRRKRVLRLLLHCRVYVHLVCGHTRREEDSRVAFGCPAIHIQAGKRIRLVFNRRRNTARSPQREEPLSTVPS